MSRQEAVAEYGRAQKLAQREYRERIAAGKNPYPDVLDEILPDGISSDTVQDIGVVEIPTNRIVGVKSAGRIAAFTATFLPLLDENTEFGAKWAALCEAHLGDTGIQEPIVCFEYLGNFYVQEGNKRVSVLRYFGAPRIPGQVHRIIPALTSEPRIKAYYEFMEFYRNTRIYDVQYTTPGNYAKLLAALDKDPGYVWTEQERRTFSSYLSYFRDAYYAVMGEQAALKPEEALLIWLKLYPYADLGQRSGAELKKTMTELKDDFTVLSQSDPVAVKTAPAPAAKANILERIISPNPDHLTVAFVHQRDNASSLWTRAHDEGRQYLENALGSQVTTLSYFHADSQAEAELLLEQAVTDGADVIFTTTPQLSRLSLKIAVKYPRVRVLNCSVNVPYPSIRTYYSRIYEGKFITGAIAGAMAVNNRIGYVGSSPIYGVPASINAFALGAQLTNPRAKIELRWSCQAGDPVSAFIGEGLSVISNRDIPTQDGSYMLQGDYGTYLVEDSGTLVPLGSPCWLWGKFYENVVQSILSGAWNNDKTQRAVNYWWGMDSGVIDVKLSDRLPEGLRSMAEILKEGLRSGKINPFFRRIVAQDGTVKNDGSRAFTPDELLHMDWLCDNVEGVIPSFDEIEPYARPMVRELGIYRDQLPAQKEVQTL